MRRLVVSVVVPLLVFLAATLPAHAGFSWCKSDPVVELNGT